MNQEEVTFLSEIADAYVRRAETSSRKWVELLKVSLIDFCTVDWNYFAPKNICENARKPRWENFCDRQFFAKVHHDYSNYITI